MNCGDLVLCFMAIFLPPFAVLLKTGCDINFWLSIFLTLLFYFPGLIYAWFVLLFVPRPY